MSLTPRRARRLTLIALTIALAAALLAGALRVRHDYLWLGQPAALPGPIAHGRPALGLNVALEQYAAADLAGVLAEIEATGAAAVKQTFFFATETPDWRAADAILTAVAATDLQLVVLLDGSPADGFAPPADPAAFAAWAGAFAGRYGDQIDYYLIWDEPNLTSHWGGRPVNPADYAALFTAAAAAVRAADRVAYIGLAPLAPTVETGPANLADHLYLQSLYESGLKDTFDFAAGKPYGFDTGPDDRRVAADQLNFSRLILLREVMLAFDDGDKAVWAGNWGWNSLPAGWTGTASVWGQTDAATQADRTLAALARAQSEWPWAGFLFLENWQPAAPADDPRWGFSIAGRPAAAQLAALAPPTAAGSGFHLAQADGLGQEYDADWRFAPEFGADIVQDGAAASFTFSGTEIGLWVRRGSYRARIYAYVDGEPANLLPRDEIGPALVLTAPDPDRVANPPAPSLEPLARDLAPGVHTLTLHTSRGWDQWALYGFSVASRPTRGWEETLMRAAALIAGIAFLVAARCAFQADWTPLRQLGARWRDGVRLVVTLGSAALVALSGWLTWGQQAAGLYRRLGDLPQLTLTAAAASIFYVAPSFFVYVAALLLLFLLLYGRPVWGLCLVIAVAPFYVLPKPLLGYRFSPGEIFLLVTLAATAAHWLTAYRRRAPGAPPRRVRLTTTDWAVVIFVLVATASLPFSGRQDVASNEWRVVVVEPALFYGLWRWLRPTAAERRRLVQALVLGGLAVAVIGLARYALGIETITSGGLTRLNATYGSPNNVALYLVRILPFALAPLLFTRGQRRVWAAVAGTLLLALLLTFSRGGLFLGLPAGLAALFILWQRRAGRRAWPWLLAAAAAAGLALLIALQVPAVAARLNPQGATSFARVYLWQASINIFRDHPWIGIGLDNFLYEHRGRYILAAAWQEPDLSHPHNIVFDFLTRLGLFGLVGGGWLFWQYARNSWRAWTGAVDPATAAALLAALAALIAHGLVDHSFFLVDLAYFFFFALALGQQLAAAEDGGRSHAPDTGRAGGAATATGG